MRKVHTSKWASRCGWAFVVTAVCLSVWATLVPIEDFVTVVLMAVACGLAGFALVALRFSVSVSEGHVAFRVYGLRLYAGHLTSSTEVDFAPTVQLGTTTVGWRRIDASTFAYFGGNGPAVAVTFDDGHVVYIRSGDAIDIGESIVVSISR